MTLTNIEAGWCRFAACAHWYWAISLVCCRCCLRLMRLNGSKLRTAWLKVFLTSNEIKTHWNTSWNDCSVSQSFVYQR